MVLTKHSSRTRPHWELLSQLCSQLVKLLWYKFKRQSIFLKEGWPAILFYPYTSLVWASPFPLMGSYVKNVYYFTTVTMTFHGTSTSHLGKCINTIACHTIWFSTVSSNIQASKSTPANFQLHNKRINPHSEHSYLSFALWRNSVLTIWTLNPAFMV